LEDTVNGGRSVATSFAKSRMKILLLEGIHDRAVENFKRHGYATIERHKKALAGEELRAAVADVHFVGIRSRTRLTADLLAAALRDGGSAGDGGLLPRRRDQAAAEERAHDALAGRAPRRGRRGDAARAGDAAHEGHDGTRAVRAHEEGRALHQRLAGDGGGHR